MAGLPEIVVHTVYPDGSVSERRAEPFAVWPPDRPADPPRDKRVVQCNFRVGTPECVARARAYVIAAHPVSRRVRVLARSRSGRWIDKWENLRRLTDFRFKMIPPEHRLYGRLSETTLVEEGLQRLNEEAAKPIGPEG